MSQWPGRGSVTKWAPPLKAIKTSASQPSFPVEGTSSDTSSCGDRLEQPIATDGTPLIPVSNLPHKYRCIFIHRFPVFNVVQSKVFDDVFNSNKSIALCAPTGSGKTVVFELAIIKQLMEFDSRNQSLIDLKVVYMAPLKKLVDEKFKEFRDSFNRFGLNCLQYTGDSELEEYSVLPSANIVLTTPEKWDATLRANANSSLIRNIQLMLIDEVHSIADDQRGATMEAVISRMKTLRNILLKDCSQMSKIRMIAVSATAPNVNDIAHWLDPIENVGHNFSENLRPVRIQTIVLGIGCPQESAEFKFDINLNYKLDSVIKSHCDSKPTLIFCSTRKSVEMCAKYLSSTHGYSLNARQRLTLDQKLNQLIFKDKTLKNYVKKGVAFHHSGLEFRDRQIVENLFVENLIPVLVSTSTLSMGVNLPAHLVIIKNTVQFERNAVIKEYPPSQVLQMIGRAGRPQFDTSAVAIIMTKNSKKHKYEMLLNGTQVIESRLHEHLIEHLNAEISLRTVTSMDIAVDWIRSTFFYIRLLQNPSLYSSSIQISNVKQGLEVLRNWCETELTELRNAELILVEDDFRRITSSAIGQFMARHCISFDTMKKFCQMIGRNMELKDLIDSICETQELMQEIQLRNNDKKILNELNASKEKTCIRYQYSGKIKSTNMKISCLLQASFGGLQIQDYTLLQESLRIIRTGQRLSRCLTDLIYFKVQQNVNKIYYKTLLNILILNKCFKAKLWHDSRQIIRQMPKIGNQFSNSIMSRYKNFEEIKAANPREIEFLCNNRKPPFGTQVIDWVKRLPRYSLTITQNIRGGLRQEILFIKLKVKIENINELKTKELLNKNHSFHIIVGSDDNQLLYCQLWYDSKLFRSNGCYETKEIAIEKSSELRTIYAHLISDSFVGLDVRCTFTPVLAADTKSPPEPSQTNCSTNCSIAYSDIECETQVRPDVSESCQHKCANKSSCRHSCCKKWVSGGDGPRSDADSQAQTISKGKRQTDSQQNSANNKKKKCLKGESSGQSGPQNNLDKWLIKYPKVKEEFKEESHSKYFANYPEISDNDLDLDIDFTEFDNDLEEFANQNLQTDLKDIEDIDMDSIELKEEMFGSDTQTVRHNQNDLKLKELKEDVFDEEFDRLFECNPALNQMLQCNEDFQNFDRNSESKASDENPKKGKILIFHRKDWALEYWRAHFPAFDPEGHTFFDPSA